MNLPKSLPDSVLQYLIEDIDITIRGLCDRVTKKLNIRFYNDIEEEVTKNRNLKILKFIPNSFYNLLHLNKFRC